MKQPNNNSISNIESKIKRFCIFLWFAKETDLIIVNNYGLKNAASGIIM